MSDSAALKLFSIAAGQAFLPCLADSLLDEPNRRALFGDVALEAFEILLPTRRAARDLAGHFVTRAAARGNTALLLPHIRTLGDLDDDAPFASLSASDDGLALPPAIEPMARHYHLLKLIRFWAEKKAISAQTGDILPAAQGALNPVKLSALAFDLAGFLDQAQNEDLAWDRLPKLAPEDLAKNWQQTLDFLKIITEFWPQILAESGVMDPTARRNELLRRRRDAWAQNPPSHPVIAAGSTGSIRATAQLLHVVAGLPRGAVILPGLDGAASAAEWQAIRRNVSHPQHAMADLLEQMKASRSDVKPWPMSAPPSAAAQLLGLALAPAESTADWAQAFCDAKRPVLTHCHYIEAPEPRAEAGAIAVLMREVLQHESKTAALVTRDRNLARRVAAELQRWDIHVDDSAGQPLANRPMTNFLRRILACVTGHFAPIELLAVLKHPMAQMGRARGAHLALVRALESRLLRGPRPQGGLAGLHRHLAHLPDKPQDAALEEFLSALETAFAPFADLGEAALPAAHLAALWQTAAALMRDEAQSTQAAKARLLEGEEGRALAHITDMLVQHSDLAGPVAQADWPALFDMWVYRQPVRTQTPVTPRLMILGPLEARLMQADVMILGGLNEGSWPPLPETGPWLSRPMRAAIGMSQPERQIGQAAHDFVQSAAAQEVYLTRSQKLDGTPAVAARWLRRLETLCGALPRAQGARYLAWWQALDRQGQSARAQAQPPRPCPPVTARPTQLSVTQIETLLHNPYEIYARKILNLRQWEAVDAPPSAADRGSLVHKLFEEFIAQGAATHDNAAARFMELAEHMAQTRPGAASLLTFWRPRLQAIGAWLASHEADRAAQVKKSHVEVEGEMQIAVPGGAFKLTAKADRIDALANGQFEIIDYKTGAPPSGKKVKQHMAPQLTLEAAILRAGGFATARGNLTGKTDHLSYWQVSGRTPAAKVTQIDATPELIDGAVNMVAKLIAAYRDTARPYMPHIRPGRDGGAYDHLARRGEWQGVVDTATASNEADA